MPQNAAPMRRVLLSAKTATTDHSDAVDVSPYPHLVLYISGTGTVSNGDVVIEESGGATPADTASWSVIATVDATAVTGGATTAYHLVVGAYRWLRVRISDAITGGGSISVELDAD